MRFLGLLIIAGFLFLVFQINTVYAQTDSSNRIITVHIEKNPMGIILPVNITEKIANPYTSDTVSVWQIDVRPVFVQSNTTYVQHGVTSIPFSFNATDGNNIINNARIKGFTIGDDLGFTQATCEGNTTKTAYFVPLVEIPIISNSSSNIMVNYAKSALVPDSNGTYNLNFSSFFNTKIILPTDAIIIKNQTKICSISYDGFSKVKFYDMVFKTTSFPVPSIDKNSAKLMESLKIPSPLKQFKEGITFVNIRCNDDLVKIMKLEDNATACVKPSTQIKLEQYGWTLPITQPNKDIMYCQKNPSNACNYTMELWYNDCKKYENRNVTSCHDGRIEAYLKANGLSNIMIIHP